ncbi:MAG: hypothetical protein PHF24_00945 [Syntrophomonas sp.]|nr:hypothetical protein [Syntrophomonas sp.]
MDKGDMFIVYMNGNMMTICVIGSYKEEYSGEEMVILAVVNQDNIVHVPADDLDLLFPQKKYTN